jgi:predicted DsbA family dithiol-disulfide isomerase
VYFDYLCPYAWRGAELAARLAEPLELEFVWQHFSLWQSNYQPASEPIGNETAASEPAASELAKKLWQHPLKPNILAGEDRGGWGLLPFLVSIAARAQDASKETALRLAIFRSYHQGNNPFSQKILLDCAASVGLDAAELALALDNPQHRETLEREHLTAKKHHVFGTPTFHFAGDQLAYFRVRELPKEDATAIKLFQDYRAMLDNYPFLETVKRPRAPKS